MKLASLDDGSRDGRLVVVSRDLRRAQTVAGLARLQDALDDWVRAEPLLRRAAAAVDAGEGAALDPAACRAPLPRAYQWVDGSSYLDHVERVRRARGAELPEAMRRVPLVYQGGSDSFLGPRDPIAGMDPAWGIDFEAEIAVVTDDVPMGCDAASALSRVRLLLLANDLSLRELIPSELARGFGFVQGKPSTAFAPVAVTPDTLGAAWSQGRLRVDVAVHLNGHRVGRIDAARGMHFGFGELLAHLARTRRIGAGTIVGAGTVSSPDPAAGWACIAECRALEMVAHGATRTPWMAPGDRVRIEAFDDAGVSVFGAIEQVVSALPA